MLLALSLLLLSQLIPQPLQLLGSDLVSTHIHPVFVGLRFILSVLLGTDMSHFGTSNQVEYLNKKPRKLHNYCYLSEYSHRHLRIQSLLEHNPWSPSRSGAWRGLTILICSTYNSTASTIISVMSCVRTLIITTVLVLPTGLSRTTRTLCLSRRTWHTYAIRTVS